MARITVEDCIDKFESRFELVLVAANRARKIHSGDSPTVEKNNDKNTVIALREIADETIPVDQLKEKLVEEYQAVSMQNEEDLYPEQSNSDDENLDDKIVENKSDEIKDSPDDVNELKDLAEQEFTSLLTDANNNIKNIDNKDDNQVDNLIKNSEEEAS